MTYLKGNYRVLLLLFLHQIYNPYCMNSRTIQDLNWRYATKRFDASKKLSEEKLNILKETFNLTATSFGLQPLKLLVISNPEIKEKLMEFTYFQPQIRDASHVLVLCIESEIDASFIKDHFKRVETLRQTPRTILEPFEEKLVKDFSEKDKEDIKAWMINQVYLTLGALLTVCAVEQIDSCPMEGFEPEKYDSYLELDKIGLQSVIVLPVGYRDETDFFLSLQKVRRGVNELVLEM